MSEHEAYLEIVWRQFCRNRFALAALAVLAPLFLLATFAPLIASKDPFVYYDGRQTLYPWFRAIFNPAETVDLVFNMAMLGVFPWLIAAAGLNLALKRGGVPGRARIAWAAGLYLAIVVAVACVFSGPRRPANSYGMRSFAEEQARPGSKAWALYPPIPFGPTQQDLDAIFRPPLYAKPAALRKSATDSFLHLLGTDNTGCDVLVEMLYGSRVSLTVGFVAVGIYVAVGLALGAVAGYFGGLTDMLISRVIEVVLLFPAFFLILILVAMIGPSIYIIMVVIGLTGWPTIARLIRGEVLKQRVIDYVAAARALGASHSRIIFRHVLPNALAPALVSVPFGIADAIVTEAGLGLLGFSVRPPAPSWGNLLNVANSNYHYWWLVVAPSLAIFVTVTVFNLVGNALRDAMDPRLRG
jgi:peptide/nickel transport system permease protein